MIVLTCLLGRLFMTMQRLGLIKQCCDSVDLSVSPSVHDNAALRTHKKCCDSVNLSVRSSVHGNAALRTHKTMW